MDTTTITDKPMSKKERVEYIARKLDELYPEPPIPLDHKDPFTLLVAVLLSAQCTDERVNKVTPALFALADNPRDMAQLPEERILEAIRSCGLAPGKSRAIARLSRMLVEEYGGEVPADMAALESLPGVGHKTASVVMAQDFGELPGGHPYPPPGPTLGPEQRQERGPDRARPEAPVPPGKLEPPAPADHLLRPGVL